MSDETDGLTNLGVAGALTARYSADQRAFLTDMAALLEAVMPGEVEVERRGGLFGPKPVSGLKVRLDDFLYAMQAPSRGPVATTRTKVVRGIKLKTEELPPEVWVTALAEHLSALAERSQQTSDRLRQILGG